MIPNQNRDLLEFWAEDKLHQLMRESLQKNEERPFHIFKNLSEVDLLATRTTDDQFQLFIARLDSYEEGPLTSEDWDLETQTLGLQHQALRSEIESLVDRTGFTGQDRKRLLKILFSHLSYERVHFPSVGTTSQVLLGLSMTVPLKNSRESQLIGDFSISLLTLHLKKKDH